MGRGKVPQELLMTLPVERCPPPDQVYGRL